MRPHQNQARQRHNFALVYSPSRDMFAVYDSETNLYLNKENGKHYLITPITFADFHRKRKQARAAINEAYDQKRVTQNQKPDTQAKKRVVGCCLCHNALHQNHPKQPPEQVGNNAAPLRKGRCCDNCNITKVGPARMRLKGNWDESEPMIYAHFPPFDTIKEGDT